MQDESEQFTALVRDVENAEQKFRGDPYMMAILILIDTVAKRAKAPIGLIAADMHDIGSKYGPVEKPLGDACLALAQMLDDWVGTPPRVEASEAARKQREIGRDDALGVKISSRSDKNQS